MKQVPVAAAANYSFNVTTDGNTHTITYKRSKYGFGFLITLMIYCAIITTIFGMLFHFDGLTWTMTWLSISVGGFALLNYSRTDGQFIINETQFIVGGKSYDRNHINQIFMDSKKLKEDAYVRTNPGLGMMASQGIKDSFRNHHAKNNFYIGFRYGEKLVKLAGGMRENTAEVLFEKVQDITKMYTSA